MRRMTRALLAGTALAALVACGGGGNDEGDGPDGEVAIGVALVGTAATGAPLSGACIALVDRLGETRTAVADSAGQYRIENLDQLALPVMVRAADCTANGPLPTLYSALETRPESGNTVLNVTPVTHAVLALALSMDLADAFENRRFVSRLMDGGALAAAQERLHIALGEVLDHLGLSAYPDFLSQPFAADGTGLDKLLDLVAFEVFYDSTPVIDDYVVRVVEKSSGSTVKVTAPGTGDVPVLAAPSADVLSLDLSGIASLVASFNQLRSTVEGLKSPQMADLFHPEFMQDGFGRSDLLDEFKQEADEGDIGARFTHYAVERCDGSSKVCDLLVTDRMPDGETEQFGLKVIFDADRGQWLFLGNQIPFEFDLKPVINVNVNVSSGGMVSTTVASGVNLWLPLDARYQSARLEVSNDGGKTWLPALDLKAKPTQCPQAHYLVIDNGPTLNCGNYVSIGDTQAQAVNAVVDQGLRRYKIEVFSDESWTNSVAIHSGVTRRHLFTQVSAQAAFEASRIRIDHWDLGTDVLPFYGSGINSINAVFVTNGATTGSTTWEGRYVNQLNGYVTTPAAYALCLSNAAPEVCVGSYGGDAVIDSVFLSARTTDGRGAIWANYGRVAP